ncbi:MAG: acyltransferase [Planctomycetota bacterium]
MPSEDLVGGRPRLDFLHGLRGIAALTIVLYHCALNTGPETAGPIQRVLQAPLLHGHLAVPVFLVLSGFLLAIPIVTNGLALRGGIRCFMSRRARRILPPYYAAYLLDMIFCAVMYRLLPLLGRDPGPVILQQMETGYRWPSVAGHLLLIQNMSSAWNTGASGALWTIACEWQIYLFFAAVLVPLWQRYGLMAMLAASTLAGLAITGACARGWLFYLIPWMIIIFALGAAATTIVFGSTARAASMRNLPWGAITASTCALLVAGVWLLDATAPLTTPVSIPVKYYYVPIWIMWMYDMLAAVAAASLIVWLAVGRLPDAREGAIARRIRQSLESQQVIGLGLFAYSLYLTHIIVILFWLEATRFLAPHPVLHRVTIMLGAPLLSLLIGYLFHLCFERRWMSCETRGMFTAESYPAQRS